MAEPASSPPTNHRPVGCGRRTTTTATSSATAWKTTCTETSTNASGARRGSRRASARRASSLAPPPHPASATAPIDATASTVISPRVSKPRKSTRITLTTLRPWPSGTERPTISSDTGGLEAVTGGDQREHEHHGRRPSQRSTSRTARRRGDDCRSNRSGSRRSTSTNTTVDNVSTDGLGEGEVGCARQRRTARHRVAGDAQEHGSGEPAAHDRRAERGDDAGRSPRARRGGSERGPTRTSSTREQRACGKDRRGREDDARVHRQRAVLDEPRDPRGDHAEAAQRREVDLAAARHRASRASTGCTHRSADDSAAPPASVSDGERERHVQAVPQRQMHRRCTPAKPRARPSPTGRRVRARCRAPRRPAASTAAGATKPTTAPSARRPPASANAVRRGATNAPQ